MSLKNPQILILRLSSIGDILLTTPFIQQVRNTFPNGYITYIVKKEFSKLLQYNPHINDLILFDSSLGITGLLDLKNEMKTREFDYIFDLHNNLRTNRITSVFSRNKIFRIKKNKLKRALLVNFKINLFKEVITIPQKYRNVAGSCAVKDGGEKLELFWNEIIQQRIENLLKQNGLKKGQYICMAPGAAHFTKMWPLEYAANLVKKILGSNQDQKIVLLGGSQEAGILKEFESNRNVTNFCSKLSLLESAGILKNSKGVITNDSGLMHMASAVHIPIIALFGSTVKELGFFPYQSDAVILENENLWCRPCTHIGRRKCPLGHFNCMRQITVDLVYQAVERKLLK